MNVWKEIKVDVFFDVELPIEKGLAQISQTALHRGPGLAGDLGQWHRNLQLDNAAGKESLRRLRRHHRRKERERINDSRGHNAPCQAYIVPGLDGKKHNVGDQ